MFHSFRKGGDICFILNSSSSVCNKTDLGGRLDVPLLRLLQLDEAGLQQTPPTFFNHYRQKTRDRLKLESLCAPLMSLGLVKVREILHRELELTSRGKKLNLIWFPFSRLFCSDWRLYGGDSSDCFILYLYLFHFKTLSLQKTSSDC